VTTRRDQEDTDQPEVEEQEPRPAGFLFEFMSSYICIASTRTITGITSESYETLPTVKTAKSANFGQG
jgi:hypothetical protein